MLSFIALALALFLQCGLFAAQDTLLPACVDGCVDKDDFLVTGKGIDEKLGFCHEVRGKLGGLMGLTFLSWIRDYWGGNYTSWQKFSEALEDPKTFYDVPLRREIEHFDDPRILDFRITNSTLLHKLRDEMARTVSLVDKIKYIEFGGILRIPIPSKMDISFNYYHFFSPTILDFYDAIKGEFPEHLRNPKATSLEGLQVQIGRTPTGVHNQGNQFASNRFEKIGSEFATTFNIHFALTDVTEHTAPLVFWQGARPEVISSRYVYKLLSENSKMLEERYLKGLYRGLSWLEGSLDFWKYTLYKAEADWDIEKEGLGEFVRASYLMSLRYYLSTYCSAPDGKDLVKGIWYPVKAGQGVIFNPYQLHASDTAFPPASSERNSLIIRACDRPECKVAYLGYQPSDEKLYECFALLFGYNTTDEFKETVFGTTTNKVWGLKAVQMDHTEGVTPERLKKHYVRAKEFLSQDSFPVTPQAEQCLREYLGQVQAKTNYDI